VPEARLNKPALLDSRRLTGANLYWDRPSAIIDVQLDAADSAILVRWQKAVAELLAACDMPGEQTCQRSYEGGASLLVSAPIDVMYGMCELNEVAWARALHWHTGAAAPDWPTEIARLQGLFVAERRPLLLKLQSRAQKKSVPFLWDDDEVSIGYGANCQVWPYAQLPEPDQPNWSAAKSIPLALVTGTNGKSTSVRMVAAMLRAAGLRGGLTSTDFIRVGDEVLDEGDYSGTGGARRLLRHPRVEAAVLEVARGGLLRRGLAVERADCALVTNVAADHLGEYGINTLADLTEAKFIVHRALDERSPLVLNADDAGIVAYEQQLRQQRPGTSWWFSLQADHPRLVTAKLQGASIAWLHDDGLWLTTGDATEPRLLARVSEVRSSRGGLLRHNLQNALGAALVALAMGIPEPAIQQGLKDFQGDEQDNPGRGNWFEHKGIHILVDFAHNEHGLAALAQAIGVLGDKRVAVMLGQAGDRSDAAIRGIAQVAVGMQPDRLLVYQLPGYERGRDIAEPPALIRAEALSKGMPAERIEILPDPLTAARNMLENAKSGDVLVLLALIQRQEILQLVHEFISS
jgi:cyanophycin synthetase